MGWIAGGENRLNNSPMLWPENELPQSAPKLPERNFKSLCYPLWTQNKARLIQAYLQLFEYILTFLATSRPKMRIAISL